MSDKNSLHFILSAKMLACVIVKQVTIAHTVYVILCSVLATTEFESFIVDFRPKNFLLKQYFSLNLSSFSKISLLV